MNTDKRWSMLLAVAASAAIGAAIASWSRRQHHRAAHELQHRNDLKTWENEGGNVAPPPAAPALP
jgi:hypothetical protein